MRLATLEAGIGWDFETYPEYLDGGRAARAAINFGGYVGHTPVRLYVMGDEAYERAATEDEIDRMRGVVASRSSAGRSDSPPTGPGSTWATGVGRCLRSWPTQEETEALMRVTAEIGQGIVHVAPGRATTRGSTSSAVPRPPHHLVVDPDLPAGATSRAPYGDKLADHDGAPQRGRRRVGPGDVPAHRAVDLGWPSRRRSIWSRRFSEFVAAGPERPAGAVRRSGVAGSGLGGQLDERRVRQPPLGRPSP